MVATGHICAVKQVAVAVRLVAARQVTGCQVTARQVMAAAATWLADTVWHLDA